MSSHQSLNHQSLPTVAIVGRTNTGKSTLFNRLTSARAALTSARAETTRDWKEGIVEWRGGRFRVIDTGGVENPWSHAALKKKREDATLQELTEVKAWEQMKKSDVVVMLVDGKSGLLSSDRMIAKALRVRPLPVLLVVNKIDAPRERTLVQEFWRLGLREPLPISALTGAGTGDMLDTLMAMLPEQGKRPSALHAEKKLAVAIIGRPNVGKSSLVNALTEENRVIVSPIPGTTREPIDTLLTRGEYTYTFVDTAGIRRRAKRERVGLEAAGVARTMDALERTDVALFVVDSTEPLASQDLRLAEHIIDTSVGVVIVANKWDTTLHAHRTDADNDLAEQTAQTFVAHVRGEMPHLAWAPILFISAKTNHNVEKLFATVNAVADARTRIIPEEALNAWLVKLPYRHSKSSGAQQPHVYGIKQTGTTPPTFTVTVELKKVPTRRGMQKGTVRPSYIRFLEHRIRASFHFAGTPITLNVRGIKK